MLTFEKIKMNSIKHRLGYRKMSSNDVLSEIIAMTISDKNAKDALVHARALKKINNEKLGCYNFIPLKINIDPEIRRRRKYIGNSSGRVSSHSHAASSLVWLLHWTLPNLITFLLVILN
jgi:hypothetical protein